MGVTAAEIKAGNLDAILPEDRRLAAEERGQCADSAGRHRAVRRQLEAAPAAAQQGQRGPRRGEAEDGGAGDIVEPPPSPRSRQGDGRAGQVGDERQERGRRRGPAGLRADGRDGHGLGKRQPRAAETGRAAGLHRPHHYRADLARRRAGRRARAVGPAGRRPRRWRRRDLSELGQGQRLLRRDAAGLPAGAGGGRHRHRELGQAGVGRSHRRLQDRRHRGRAQRRSGRLSRPSPRIRSRGSSTRSTRSIGATSATRRGP